MNWCRYSRITSCVDESIRHDQILVMACGSQKSSLPFVLLTYLDEVVSTPEVQLWTVSLLLVVPGQLGRGEEDTRNLFYLVHGSLCNYYIRQLHVPLYASRGHSYHTLYHHCNVIMCGCFSHHLIISLSIYTSSVVCNFKALTCVSQHYWAFHCFLLFLEVWFLPVSCISRSCLALWICVFVWTD